MSITINGSTNTITAASGVTIAGNTAVTGTLSATGALSATSDLTVSGADKGIRVSNSSAGATVLSGALAAVGGLRLTQGEMNASAKYVTPIVFGSTDSAFTTANPKYGAGITAYATEAYTADTSGGMALEFFGVPNTPGAAQPALTSLGTWSTTGLTVTGTVSVSSHILPTIDNTSNLGSASFGMKELFSDNGTINTSDARRKTEVSALSAAEINTAKQLAKEIGSFKFLAAVAEKGDAARLHIGMTVQRAIEIMETNGLDPFAYSFICHDAWDQQVVEHPAVEAKDAVLDDEGNVVEPAVEAKDAWTEVTLEAGDKYSFRAHELLLFMAAGFEARLSALEAA